MVQEYFFFAPVELKAGRQRTSDGGRNGRRRGLEALAGECNGITFYEGSDPIILLDQDVPKVRIRFTAAHELGHLVMGHVAPQTKDSTQEKQEKDRFERAADQFAARLLAPACVLWGIGAHTPGEIAAACSIHQAAAEKRAKRMDQLYRRDQFLRTEHEQEVFRRFLPYIFGARKQ